MEQDVTVTVKGYNVLILNADDTTTRKFLVSPESSKKAELEKALVEGEEIIKMSRAKKDVVIPLQTVVDLIEK